MAKKAKARIKAPKSITKGEPFEVKTLISHNMETGQRKDKKTGEKIPRMILNKFSASYGGAQIFSADWHPAISANPFMAFHMIANESGTLELTWTDDNGEEYTKSKDLTVG